MIEQVFPFDPAPWVALVVAMASLALFAAHATDAGRAYSLHHDERAALELLMSLTQTAASVGLALAAAAPMVDALGWAMREDVRNVGFGVVGGALLVTSAVLFLIDRTLPRVVR